LAVKEANPKRPPELPKPNQPMNVTDAFIERLTE
jgi:hypothetical protein